MKKKKEYNKLVVRHLKEAKKLPNMARQRVWYELLLHQHLRLQSQTTKSCDRLQSSGLVPCFTQKI